MEEFCGVVPAPEGLSREKRDFSTPGRQNHAVPLVEMTEFGLCELLLAGGRAGEEFVHAYDLAVQRAGNERFALDGATFRVGDSDAIDFQRFADRALVIGPGFLEVGKCAKFRALRGNVVALS